MSITGMAGLYRMTLKSGFSLKWVHLARTGRRATIIGDWFYFQEHQPSDLGRGLRLWANVELVTKTHRAND
jgi:hypothetical protein